VPSSDEDDPGDSSSFGMMVGRGSKRFAEKIRDETMDNKLDELTTKVRALERRDTIVANASPLNIQSLEKRLMERYSDVVVRVGQLEKRKQAGGGRKSLGGGSNIVTGNRKTRVNILDDDESDPDSGGAVSKRRRIATKPQGADLSERDNGPQSPSLTDLLQRVAALEREHKERVEYDADFVDEVRVRALGLQPLPLTPFAGQPDALGRTEDGGNDGMMTVGD